VLICRTVKETKRIHELEKAREVMPTKSKKKQPSPELSDISDYDFEDFDSEVDFSDDDLSAAGAESGSDLGSDDDMDSDMGSEGDSEDGSDDSDDGDDSDQSALNAEFDDVSDDESESEDEAPRKRKKRTEEEAEYEVAGRARWAEQEDDEDKDTLEVGRLPIKLPTGEVKLVEGSTVIAKPKEKKKAAPVRAATPEESDAESEDSDTGAEANRMAAQPGRFGRMGVAQIVAAKGWKNAQRLAAAKEQMAEIGAEILAGGELIDVGPILTRLSTWALPTVPNPDPEEDNKPLPVPNSIRAMALLSQLAVFKDLIPGYRIRQLTAHEEAEKVRDEVRRMREGEKMLVRNYKSYLKSLEAEVKCEYSHQLGCLQHEQACHEAIYPLTCSQNAPRQRRSQVSVRAARLCSALQLLREHHGRARRPHRSPVVGRRLGDDPGYVCARLPHRHCRDVLAGARASDRAYDQGAQVPGPPERALVSLASSSAHRAQPDARRQEEADARAQGRHQAGEEIQVGGPQKVADQEPEEEGEGAQGD